MDNIVIITDSESDSDYSFDSDTHDQREEVVYENTHFMNHEKVEDYEKNRNKLFTKDIEKRILLVDTNHINRDNNQIADKLSKNGMRLARTNLLEK